MPAFRKTYIGRHVTDMSRIYHIDQVLGAGSFYYCEGCLINSALGNLNLSEDLYVPPVIPVIPTGPSGPEVAKRKQRQLLFWI